MTAGRMIFPLNSGCKNTKILHLLMGKLPFIKEDNMSGLILNSSTMIKRQGNITLEFYKMDC
jgi:hypothetical protein